MTRDSSSVFKSFYLFYFVFLCVTCSICIHFSWICRIRVSFSSLHFFKGLFVSFGSVESLFCAFELGGFEVCLIRLDALVEVCECCYFRSTWWRIKSFDGHSWPLKIFDHGVTAREKEAWKRSQKAENLVSSAWPAPPQRLVGARRQRAGAWPAPVGASAWRRQTTESQRLASAFPAPGGARTRDSSYKSETCNF